MKTNTEQDMAAIEKWIAEYAMPHLMKSVRHQINNLTLKSGDEIMLNFGDGGPEMFIPAFVVEHFLKKPTAT